MTAHTPAVELRAISKRYGGDLALDGASLAVHPGSLHVLLGENGAGKTTLLQVAVGLRRPDSGEILVDGTPVAWASYAEASAAGLSAVQQHLSLVPSMTVAENVALAGRHLAQGFSPIEAAKRVANIAEAVGLDVNPGAVVGTLSVAAQQRAEIIKAISHDPRVLFLDEPTAALSPTGARDLFIWLRNFVSLGHAAVVITHRMREALEYGDVITVLRRGSTVLATAARDVGETALFDAVLGGFEAHATSTPPARLSLAGDAPHGIVLNNVCVDDASGVTRLRNASFTIHPGEILGVAGVDGSGQRELLRVISGRLAPTRGSVTIPDAIGFVPEDRLQDALIGELSLTENFALRGAGARRGVMHWRAVRSRTDGAMAQYDVRGRGAGTVAAALSGGNQQKFVLARELDGTTRLLVAENPARGLDVRAATAVFDRMRQARAAGSIVVVYSPDIDEILDLADRVVVCFGGSVREVPCSADFIGSALIGAA